ncbi:ATP-binding protein [Clostridium diolis]|uniref:histidine kinase n=1 Tax=Clostridium diolis TaxID=223919 RepID=A0AAV3W605_9CLOT|nr:ATP-binding protein [Clostridium diolis]GEA33970.1 hypothetical protein CDIOL_48930 [Clostridium diolis]
MRKKNLRLHSRLRFFYDDEIIDIEYFRRQAQKFGFDEKEYLEALSKVPIFPRKQVNHIIECLKGLIIILTENGLSKLEFKKSQNELEKSQKYLNAIFNSVNDAILIHDYDGNISDVNQTAIAMFGYSRNEFIHMRIKDVISKDSPDPYLTKEELLDRIAKEGRLNSTTKTNMFIGEAIFIGSNNSEFWGERNVIIANIGGAKRVITTVRNISERKQAELALKNESLELERLRTEFFANISHELRTPLNIILNVIKISCMNLEQQNVGKEKIISNMNMGKQNCLRLLRLVNNLIDSTKLDAGYFEVNFVNCNVINVIEEITLSVAEYIKSNNLNLIFDTEIEEKIIACDLDKIERIILNILSNAIKFTKPGGNIFVNIFDGEEFITIVIEDTGIGIPEEKLNVIFDRFRQIDKSFTRNYEGSGIGLSLVKSLVEMQGGKITVESKYGTGTKFYIKLPVRLAGESNSKENIKLFNSNLSNHVEKINVEFSDIYTL